MASDLSDPLDLIVYTCLIPVKYWSNPSLKFQRTDSFDEEQKNDFQPDLHCGPRTLRDSLWKQVIVRHDHFFTAFNDLVERQVAFIF